MLLLPARLVTEMDDVQTNFEALQAWSVSPAWITPTPTSPYTNFGAGLVPLRYLKDPLGFVHLEGFVALNAATSGATLLTLPAGYRPSLTIEVPASLRTAGNNAPMGFVQVESSGVVMPGWTGTPTVAGFSVSFLAEQ